MPQVKLNTDEYARIRLGDLINRKRKNLRITYKQLAEAIGKDPATIYRQIGSGSIPFRDLRIYFRVLKFSPREILEVMYWGNLK